MPVQMDEPLSDLPGQVECIFRGEEPLGDHLCHVQPVNILEDDERRYVAGCRELRVIHAYHVGMLRNAQQRPVLLLQPLKRRVPVLQDQLQRTRHVTQRVDDLVDDTERSCAETLLDLVFRGH